MLGYFINNKINNKKISAETEKIIYLAGLAGAFGTLFISTFASYIRHQPNQTFYDKMTVNLLIQSIAVFVLFKRLFSNRKSKIISKLAKYSFGAYLVHDLIIAFVRNSGLNPLSFNPIFSVPLIAIIVFICSFIISGILNQIPVLKKYIV